MRRATGISFFMAQTVTIDFSQPVPLFPLPGCMLLPHATVPLHIFESRYRDMVGDVLDGAGLIAMGGAACASTGGAGTLGAEPQAVEAAQMNPLLEAWTGPYGGVPPWDQVRPADFPEAFATAIDLRQAEIDAIANDPEPPTFENTFVPLEDAGRELRRLYSLFGVMTSNVSTPEIQAIDREWSPKLAAASDEITFNTELFSRIDQIYQNREQAGLSPEQQRLLRGWLALAHDGAGPMELRSRVTSPNGTTHAAISHLESKEWKEVFKQAVTAAKNRATELGKA